MIEVAIVVEGETEEAFVNQVLSPALFPLDVSMWPTLPGRRRKRGGAPSWLSVRADVLRLLKERTGRRCGIMFDYYGLPTSWPGLEEARAGQMSQRAKVIEDAVAEDIREAVGDAFDSRLFVPHIQLHEYEAKLFSDCAVLAQVTGIAKDSLEQIVTECGSPENIDDGVESAPSKRLKLLCPRYQKIVFGMQAVKLMGLDSIRSACPHFNSWMESLESMSPDRS